jgi:outer membrane protein assembly factor BamB
MALAFAVLTLGTACTQLAAPEGWAGPVLTDVRIENTNSNVVLTVPEKGKLVAYDLSQNRLLWQFPASGQKHRNGKDVKINAIYTTPVLSPSTASQSTVYIGGYDGYVYAVDMANGSLRWEFKTDGPIIGSLLFERDTVYAASTDGNVYAVSAADGAPRWPTPFKVEGRIWSRPTLADGILYITSLAGTVYAINAETGASAGDCFSAKAGIASPAVVTSGKVLVGGFDSKLYALEAHDLRDVAWEFPADNWFWTEPLVQGNVVYAGSLDGKIYAIDLTNGSELWQRNLAEPIRAKPIMSQGVLVVINKKGEVRTGRSRSKRRQRLHQRYRWTFARP